ncbi:hypothetical protein EDB87DRAFT_1283036 [Lactarius vividus]|nr:hypothetical protein EDB87DRAFT_1283036 [Lactarius vividus]
MSIKSGQRYKITNEQHKLAIDLSAADHKHVLGNAFHGGENQLWITEKQANGQWTIRSVEHQKYLAVETTPYDGTYLVGLDQPQFWDIEIPIRFLRTLNPALRYANGSVALVSPPITPSMGVSE